jgi:hypothetical protein
MVSMVDHSLQNDPELAPAIERANRVLREYLGRLVNDVQVHWGRAQDERGGPGVELELSDEFGSVARRFSIAEVRDTDGLKSSLNRLWGELLDLRIGKLVDRMNSRLKDLDEG